MPQNKRTLTGILLALIAGAALLLAFPRYGLWWTAPLGVAALALAVDGRRLRPSAGLGLLAGVVFFAPLLAWTNLHTGYAPWLILSLYQAVYFVVLAMALAFVTPLGKRRPALWPLLIALLWVGQEALRDRFPFGGFPWGRLAFSQGDSPALAFASIGGAPLVTFIVALAGGALALAIRTILLHTNPSALPDPSANGHAAPLADPGAANASAAGTSTAFTATASTASGFGSEGHATASTTAANGVSGSAGAAEGAGAGMPGSRGPESLAGGTAETTAGVGHHAWKIVAASVAAAVALMVAGLAIPLSKPDGAPVTVAIVQGNVPRMGLDFNAQRKAVLENHVRATIDLADKVKRGEVKQPDLVIWPENASDIDPLLNMDAAAAIDDAALAIQAPILVGAVLSGPGENQSRNAGIVWIPGSGPNGMYLKRHPVPFAEYMPMRPLVEPIARAITNKAKLLRTDFVSGTVPGVLEMDGVKVGDVICFEVAYDEVVRDVVTSGADLLAVQTNNATFDASEAAQQLAMVRLRAVEHGRDALMASTVGISAFVTADGAVHQPTIFNTEAVIVHELRPGRSTTLATGLGMWPEAGLTLLAVAALAWTAVTRRRRAM
nr:apolipoprotein N-acyltransferase [Catelliglobosispora koreensis]